MKANDGRLANEGRKLGCSEEGRLDPIVRLQRAGARVRENQDRPDIRCRPRSPCRERCLDLVPIKVGVAYPGDDDQCRRRKRRVVTEPRGCVGQSRLAERMLTPLGRDESSLTGEEL
ncbi:MAG TPA: hypothetical protein VE644_07825, partial [Gaiellaceae bacterium]|nr:hypothetical protein [Gaiellaceae bacterium]